MSDQERLGQLGVSHVPTKGVYAFAIYRSGEGWPMSNYRPEGCKHDATGEIEQKLNAGVPQRCVKCGCLLIPEATYRAQLADFERRWGQ